MTDDPPSRWLGALAVAGRATRPLPRLVCVWSRAHVLMLPAETARVAGVELAGFRHSAFLLRPRALQRVFATLEAAP